MNQHPLTRCLLYPLVIPCLVMGLLLVANFVPQARFTIPVILDPSSKKLPPCDAVLQYGWPKIARVEEGNHNFGTNKFYAQTTQTSVVTHVANGIFGVALVLLSALATRLIVDRKLSLKSVLAVATLAGVLLASSALGVSLRMSNSMSEALRWTEDVKHFGKPNPSQFLTAPI
jgi:hypothetical protein